MKFLLDTCVLSEFTKPYPDEKVLKWMYNVQLYDLLISSLTIGEIWKGIVRLKTSRRKSELENWFNIEILNKYSENILSATKEITMLWGEIKAGLELSGNTVSVIDSMIASTAIYYNLTVATRNTKDFLHTGCKLFNPWE